MLFKRITKANSTISVVKCWLIKCLCRMCSEIGLINPKLVQVFVHHKMQIFNTQETVDPRSSIQIFFKPAASQKHA